MDEGREQKSVKSERESALSFERSFVVVVVAWGGQMAPHARVAFNFFSTIFFFVFSPFLRARRKHFDAQRRFYNGTQLRTHTSMCIRLLIHMHVHARPLTYTST